MAQTHLSYSDFASIYGDLGVTEWVKYNWLSDYWKTLTPDGFERVQWLQSDGNQWIDTGVDMSAGGKIECTVKAKILPNNWVFFGGAETTETAARNQSFLIGIRWGIYGAYIGRAGSGESYGTADENVHHYILEGKPGSHGFFYIDDQAPIDIGLVQVITSATYALYGVHRTDNTFVTNGGSCAIYSYYMYDTNNQLVRYFIPMLRTSDNKPGLYDLVNHQFYTNQGLLDFLAGPPAGYTQVEYLESDGNQWIDTGLKGNLNSSATLVAQLTAAQNKAIMMGGYSSNNVNAFVIGVTIAGDSVYAQFDTVVPTIQALFNPDLNKHTYKLDQSKYTVDGTTYRTFSSPSTFETYRTIRLWTGYLSTDEAFFPVKARIYSYEINDLLTPLQILIPTLDPTNRPCMYDLITRTPFYNQGSGEFTWG